MIEKVQNVNIAEIKVVFSPTQLNCLGLGSCVAIVLYDPQHKIGGLAHIMLPHSEGDQTNPGRFANTAINELLKRMKAKGANSANIYAKIFGGADMFALTHPGQKSTIGESNIGAAIAELKRNLIPIVAKDVGGTTGRNIYFSTTDGHVVMKKIKGGVSKEF